MVQLGAAPYGAWSFMEDSFDTTLPMRTEMDWLIYNAPLEYAQMVLDGTLEQYLREAAGTHGLDVN